MDSRAGKKEYPEWEELKEFLVAKIHAIEAMSIQFKVPQTKLPSSDKRNLPPTKKQVATDSNCRVMSVL